MRSEASIRHRDYVIGMMAALLLAGCVHEEPLTGPHLFDPEVLLREELQDLHGPSSHDQVILPEDLDSRPELKKLIKRYRTIQQADSNLAALAFVNEALALPEDQLAARDRADLHLVRATTLYAMADFPEAMKSCEQAIDFDSENWRAFHFRALLREKKDDVAGFHDDLRHVDQLRGGKPTRPLSTKGGVI